MYVLIPMIFAASSGMTENDAEQPIIRAPKSIGVLVLAGVAVLFVWGWRIAARADGASNQEKL